VFLRKNKTIVKGYNLTTEFNLNRLKKLNINSFTIYIQLVYFCLIERKIIHIDMDAFFASVEQRDNPALAGKPIAVGGDRNRGVVAAASYEARKYGVRSAMPSRTALKLCSELIFVKPRFEAYKEASVKINEIFAEYTDLIEPLSLDEAFLDVTNNHKGISTASEIALMIKEEIKNKLNLTASAGISYNKFLAKIATDINKPDGIFIIKPSQAVLFLEKLEVKKFFGIGKVTAQKMLKMGVIYGNDLKKISEQRLNQHFGKAGKAYYNLVRGIDNRPVNPNRERKSIGAETTFEKDITDVILLQEKLLSVIDRLHERAKKVNKFGYTVTLKIKYSDFSQITRSKTLADKILTIKTMKKIANSLLNNIENIDQGVRLIGFSISNFEKETKKSMQLTFNF
jgi:DNA polymerase-4|tara:strand:+ start:1241 stop:2434 length:1194 start_codon:yes stop_codon:yes gene_type:complete